MLAVGTAEASLVGGVEQLARAGFVRLLPQRVALVLEHPLVCARAGARGGPSFPAARSHATAAAAARAALVARAQVLARSQ